MPNPPEQTDGLAPPRRTRFWLNARRHAAKVERVLRTIDAARAHAGGARSRGGAAVMPDQSIDTASVRPFFDRIVVISLARRDDRRAHLLRHFEEIDWPFVPPALFDAIDGGAHQPPAWWHAGAPAWGCYLSHRRVMESALADGVERLLVLEDDVRFVADFRVRAGRLLRQLPDDWEMLYLGGQHQQPERHVPAPVHSDLVRARQVTRTHAYAIRRRCLARVVPWLADDAGQAEHPHRHLDHRLAALHEAGGCIVYAAVPWLAGQQGGYSDIQQRPLPGHFWNLRTERPALSLSVDRITR
jgi:hypothetical protein